MFLDGQNTFSAVTTGDAFTAQTDNVSANYIDQGVSGLAFRGEGGAYVAPWLIAKVRVLREALEEIAQRTTDDELIGALARAALASLDAE